MQITIGLPEPKEFSSLPRLRLVQSGIKRAHAQRSPLSNRIRLPITPAILGMVKEHWTPRAADRDIKMLWAASVLCFFGFFRAGEITLPSLNAFDSGKHLSWGDIAVDSLEAPTMLKIRLKKSKTDQLGNGADVFVGKTGCALCPVAGVLAYMAVRGDEEGPFFKFDNGQPLTKSKFTQRIRQALQVVGLPCQSFAGHSFRIGAATSAARAGIEDSTIQMLGRWNSAAFLAYIRIPREQLARLSMSIARS